MNTQELVIRSSKPPQVTMTVRVERALRLRNLGEPLRDPVRLSADSRREITQAAQIYSERLNPCDPQWLLEKLTRLLGHYWQKFDDETQQRAVLEDWLEDLQEYPAWALAEVFKEWRRREQYAPKINEIRHRVQGKIDTDQRRLRQLRKVLEVAE